MFGFGFWFCVALIIIGTVILSVMRLDSAITRKNKEHDLDLKEREREAQFDRDERAKDAAFQRNRPKPSQA